MLEVLSESPKSSHRPMGLILRRWAGAMQKPQLAFFTDCLFELASTTGKGTSRGRRDQTTVAD
jgi:hypothetical protein